MRENLNILLVESGILEREYYDTLNESEKSQSISSVLMDVLNSITSKLTDINTVGIDSTKGDIKYFDKLNDIQEAVEILKRKVDELPAARDLKTYVSEISKAVMNINKFSREYKDAYRTKKTLIILQYQSIMFSIVSSIAYLLSVVVLADGNGNGKSLYIKNTVLLKNITKYNKDVEMGRIKKLFNDVETVRESVEEVNIEEYVYMEAYDFGSMLTQGLKSFANKYSPTLVDTLYKSSGILVLLMSVKEVIYAIYRSGFDLDKITEYIKNAVTFLKSKFKPTDRETTIIDAESREIIIDAEEADDLSDREVKQDNRNLAKDIKQLTQNARKNEEEASEVFDDGGLFSF